MAQQAEPIAHRLDLLHVVAAYKDGRAELMPQLDDVVENGTTRDRVETQGRLFHEQHGAPVQPALCDLQATNHSAGEALHKMMRYRQQFH